MRILKDSFPARVKVTAREDAPATDHVFYASRAIVTETELIVAIDHATGPIIVLREPHDGSESALSGPLYSSAQISPDTTCGCGSRLRSWNPYRIASS